MRSSERKRAPRTAASSYATPGKTWKVAAKAKTGNQIWGREKEKNRGRRLESQKYIGTHRDTHGYVHTHTHTKHMYTCREGVRWGEEKSRQAEGSV